MLSELLYEIEERIRLIVREEIRMALAESQNSSSKKEFVFKPESKTRDEKTLPQLLTASQVAEILGVKVQRVYELTRQRKRNNFPVIIIGERSYRYSREAILAWLERDLNF